MKIVLLVLLAAIIPITHAQHTPNCTITDVYHQCNKLAPCWQALDHPSLTQFTRIQRHVPIDCSAQNPAYDFALRVTNQYVCPSPYYRAFDDNGSLVCRCPNAQSCLPPRDTTLVVIVAVGIIAVLFFVYKTQTNARKHIIDTL